MQIQKMRPYTGDGKYIFISYSHKDGTIVHNIIKHLIEAGYNVWYDEGIVPGNEWDDDIAAHIENCDSLLAFISENYLASENCKDELNFARDENKERLLVYLENVELPRGMAMRMNRLQAIHMYSFENDNSFYKKLFDAPMIERSRSAIVPQPSPVSKTPVPINPIPSTPISATAAPKFSPSMFIPAMPVGRQPEKKTNFPSKHVTDKRYQLEEKIGAGAMATVYKALDLQENRTVAIKFYYAYMAATCPFFSIDTLSDRIMRINHPGLYKIYDADEILTPYIVTEYIDGMPLSRYLKGDSLYAAYSFDEVLGLFCQILEALNALHEHGIFYGDVTPDNIMLSKTMQISLIDYTECNFNGEPAPDRTHVVQQFMSPERSSCTSLDYRSDIYEAGVLLEEMIMKSIAASRWSYSANTTNAYNTPVFDIIRKATQLKPEDRYQSTSEMIAEIKKLLQS